jgi:hypothetical protein
VTAEDVVLFGAGAVTTAEAADKKQGNASRHQNGEKNCVSRKPVDQVHHAGCHTFLLAQLCYTTLLVMCASLEQLSLIFPEKNLP